MGQLAKGAKGQVSSMGLAVKSAYSKTTKSITGMFTPAGKEEAETTPENDPLSLSNSPKAVSPEVFVANGQLWETTGNLDKAMEQYVKALEAEPENASALASVARLYEKKEQHSEAVDYFNRALKVAPNDAGLYNDLGLTYSKLGKHQEAIEQLQRAIAISPSTTRYANNLAVVQMNAGQNDVAMQTLMKAHEPATAHYNMAWMYYQRQDITATREHLGQALQIDPNMSRAKELMDKIGSPRVAAVTQGAAQVASTAIQQYNQFAGGTATGTGAATPSTPPSLATGVTPMAGTSPAPVVKSSANVAPVTTPPAATSTTAPKSSSTTILLPPANP